MISNFTASDKTKPLTRFLLLLPKARDNVPWPLEELRNTNKEEKAVKVRKPQLDRRCPLSIALRISRLPLDHDRIQCTFRSRRYARRLEDFFPRILGQLLEYAELRVAYNDKKGQGE